MASTTTPPSKLPKELEEDNRDVADLWKQALQNYKGIVGFGLERKFDNAQAMIDFGTEQMNNFHKFRHDAKKVDKLRSIFKSNLDLLEKGAQQLLAAATPAFPPAAAIGTAMTYILQACRSLSADYDVVMMFFDDMNSFLQRIVILETRLPGHKAYQNCLMDVFNSFLSMCGFAHKFIVLGRFKKWITNLLEGQDSELAGARKTMDKNLSRLQNATEFAILGNTEETKKMAQELRQNSAAHTRMLEEQREVLGSLQETAVNTHNDVQKILKLMSIQGLGGGSKAPPPQTANKPPLANRVRSALPTVDADSHEYSVLKETMIPNTCAWLFTEPAWGTWTKQPKGQKSLLAIAGPPGAGKSHLALAVHDKLCEFVADDAEKNTALAHFYFREQQNNFKYFLCGIITTINQIAEQNAQLCDKISAALFSDEVLIDNSYWQELIKHVISPVFAADSKNHLFLLLDGLDELSDYYSFLEFVEMIANEKLNISVVVTCRDSYIDSLPQDIPPLVIEVTKEKQLTDLKALTWHRIKELSNLRTFAPYVQTRIADTIVEASPTLLYAEHMLVRLNDHGREGAVLKAIHTPMPTSIHGLYEILLEECQRRMTATHQRVATMLLHWMAFARRDMALDEVLSLLKYVADDENFTLEEMPEVLHKFLRVGDPVELESRLTLAKAQYDVSDVEKDQDGYLYDDGNLPVKFRERAMLDFFREEQEEDKPFRWQRSEAQRRMFLAVVDIAQPTPEGSDSKFHPELQNYAADELLSYWFNINPQSHSDIQLLEVMEGLAAAMSNKTGLAEMLSRLPELFYTGTEDATEGVDEKIKEWVKLLEKEEIVSRLSKPAAHWWNELSKDTRKLRLGLARGFLELLYRAPDATVAQKQFHLTKNVLHVCRLQSLLVENAQRLYPEKASVAEEEISEGMLALGVINLFEDISMDDRAYRAVSEVIADYHLDIAEDLCQKALQLNSNTGTITERCKIWILLANIRFRAEKLQESQQAIEACLEYLQNETVPVPIKQEIWITKALVETKLGDSTAAAASYRGARAVDPSVMVSGEVLVKELALYRKKDDKHGYISTMKTWTPLERLTWLAWHYTIEGEVRQAYFRDCATALNEKDFIVSVYQETIRYLQNINASAPLQLDLALVYLQVLGDIDSGLKVLDEAFETSSNGWAWAITNEDPQLTLVRGINIMTDALFEQFYQSKNPEVKLGAFKKLKGLLQKTFALCVPIYSPLVLLNYHITLATMCLKLRQATEFQSLLQSVIDSCFVALTDKVGWNDGRNMMELGRAVAILAKAIQDPVLSGELRRYARIMISAIFSRLDLTLNDELTQQIAETTIHNKRLCLEEEFREYNSDDQPDDEGDLVPPAIGLFTCDGACRPVAEWAFWGKQVAYCCMTCSVTLLCEPCHSISQAGTGVDTSRTTRFFCGQHHDYVKLPIEGWQGVKDGKFMLAGEEPISVDDFYDGLKKKVEEAWNEFWSGA